jgi:hypothetical protein
LPASNSGQSSDSAISSYPMKARSLYGRARVIPTNDLDCDPSIPRHRTPTTAETKPASDSKTTGNAATSATAAPPAEKRTQITSAIKQEKVEEVKNVNFNISVGTAVPAGVRYHPMPSHIVEIYPEWRGYDFILVRGQYIVLRPHTHEIVYIIEG